MTAAFLPHRVAALQRLQEFLPQAGHDYARRRNHDRGPDGHPDVSRLSPFLRHRVLTEAEVLQAVLARHTLSAAEKFVQEVFWRSYWKGWLEMRPAVWTGYRAGVVRALDRVNSEGGLRDRWAAACGGETGIEGFDDWARELAATGYLHNHARMWFASIWIFTLELPWELGADFFLRHLLDGDPAANTLSWRWVAGLQTRGKVYAADPANIAKYTQGRFRPRGLTRGPVALEAPPDPPPAPLPTSGTLSPDGSTGWLLTEEDLSPGFSLPPDTVPCAVLDCTAERSPLAVAPGVTGFVSALIDDAQERYGRRFSSVTRLPQAAALAEWAAAQGVTQVGTAWAPVGPAAEALGRAEADLDAAGIRLIRVRRDYDSAAWPHATRGFFRFRKHIPELVDTLGLRPAVQER